MFKFFKEIRKVFHNSTGNSQGSILHEYFNWQDPLRILNFLRLQWAQQFPEGYSARYYPLNLHLILLFGSKLFHHIIYRLGGGAKL